MADQNLCILATLWFSKQGNQGKAREFLQMEYGMDYI